MTSKKERDDSEDFNISMNQDHLARNSLMKKLITGIEAYI